MPAHVSPDLPPTSGQAGSTQGAGVNYLSAFGGAANRGPRVTRARARVLFREMKEVIRRLP